MFGWRADSGMMAPPCEHTRAYTGLSGLTLTSQVQATHGSDGAVTMPPPYTSASRSVRTLQSALEGFAFAPPPHTESESLEPASVS